MRLMVVKYSTKKNQREFTFKMRSFDGLCSKAGIEDGVKMKRKRENDGAITMRDR